MFGEKRLRNEVRRETTSEWSGQTPTLTSRNGSWRRGTMLSSLRGPTGLNDWNCRFCREKEPPSGQSARMNQADCRSTEEMGPHLDLCSCFSCRFCPEREPPPGSVCEGEIWLGWRSVHEGTGRLDLYKCIVEMYSSIAEESSERHRTRTTLRNKIPVRHKSTFV